MSERNGARVLLKRRDPPGLRRAPVVRSSADAAVLRGWCLECAYDLRGIHGPEAACPECGKSFVPVDERSFAGTALVEEQNAVRLFIRRHGLKIAVVLFVAALWVYGLLPHAVAGQGGRLWAWGYWTFGEERETRVNGAEARYWWWAGRLWSAEVDRGPRAKVKPGDPPAPDPGLAWEMRRTRDGVWTLIVHEEGVPFAYLNSVFNEMKRPGMFGIYLENPGRSESPGPFEVTGSKTEVMSRIVSEYECRPVPFLLRRDQPFVWMFDPVSSRLFPMATGAAMQAGVEIRGSRVIGDERLFIHPLDEGVAARGPEEPPEEWLPDSGPPRANKPKG